ncbi:claudin 18 [Ictalurus punctatus]|uniref:Claudin n=1 Tax=Ictalurus punctatus TaxID=7998 RepID=A0A0B5H106_ICTPU|nr:claudin 18 [Ictalurus punctatus]AJF34911.1 claudin 18b [Ictalurus punctatus]
MATSGLQIGGFLLGVIGVAAVIAATAMNNWSTQDRQGDVVTAVYTYKGLWQDCEVSTSGFTECRPLYGLLGYSAQFQAVRAMMIVSVILGIIAGVISLFSLKCFKMGSTEDSTKAKMTLTAGIMFIIAGICGITGASIYANQIVASFMMTTYNPNYGGMNQMQMEGMGMSMVNRFTFGPPLFVAWIGGGMLLIGGVLKCVAFKGLHAETIPYKTVAYKVPAQSRSAEESSERGQKYV